MFDRRRLQTGLAEDLGLDSAAVPVSARVDRLPSYPLTVLGYDEPQLLLGVIWDGRRFVDGAPRLMLEQVRATLLEFAARPGAALADLTLAAPAEPELIEGWNRTGGDLAAGTIPELFAEQVRRQPTALAVQGPDGQCSYAELDQRSDRLARALRRHGVGTGSPVAVALPRGLDLIVALLAVLKAGGAYLPIDPASPSARVAGMLAVARLALAETATAVPAVPGVEVRTLAELADDDGPLPASAHPLSLAYLSYTSGSTGIPKGVAIPHRAVVRLISDPTFVRLGPGERVLQLAPVAFDASTLEIWGALLTGATLVIAPPGPLGLPELADLLRTGRISVAWLTAGLFHQLVELDVQALAGVGQLLAGGDVLDPGAVRTALAARAGRPLVNGYGPTENTTFTTCHSLTAPDQVGAVVPIGAPIQHTTVQVLDGQLRPVPIGVAGELYTGGAGLAQGYQGNPAATARAFVPDPAGSGGRLYRTGDLVRWRADGVLEFIGRLDDQVKIRGFRVEPGEVEAVLRSYPGVAAAAVLVRGEGVGRHLVGYVRTDRPDRVRPDQLREFLSYRLPDYLVPAGFAVLEKFPLNANGKIDRGALGEPDRETRQPASPPRGDTELRLAGIWRQLLPDQLPATGPGREDSFFALGGNSLSAARLMFRIREVFDVELPLATFYSDATLAACGAAIEAGRVADTGPRPATISRRSRAAYRVQSDRPALASHLVRLTDDWALWRNVCLRAAGFEVGLLSGLGDPALAALADAAVADRATEDGYRAEFPAAVGRLSAALHRAAGLPALREAVAWQNRHALSTG
ncbi:MAG TPA: non-ribosomal peptide synthetase, partial [Jatrophihabitans sp.]|nr:non-ribosomal peptide synthetase [Jatrophihabitans sp.]